MMQMSIERMKEIAQSDPQLAAMIAAKQQAAKDGEHPIIERALSIGEVPYIPGLLDDPVIAALNGKQKWPPCWHEDGSNYGYGSPGPIRWKEVIL